MSSDSETKKIKAALVLEIIGKPANHLIQTLENLIKQMDGEKGVSVVDKKIREPTEMKDNKEFFTTFAEVEVQLDDILYLAILLFKYMPAHVEVIEPELIALTNNGWSDILSELARRLHSYDEVARVLKMQNAQLQKKVKELMPQETRDKKEEKK